MVKYQVLYWKDVPAQVKVLDGHKALSRPMPERFQLEIDRRAMEEGLIGGDDYLNQWHWTTKLDRPGNAEEVLNALLRELEAEYDCGAQPRK
jgi:hypothetical protein